MNTDRQRIAAVRLLEDLGYRWRDHDRAWTGPAASAPPGPRLLAAANALHDEISDQIEDLAGCIGGSPEADNLERLVDLAQTYESARPRD